MVEPSNASLLNQEDKPAAPAPAPDAYVDFKVPEGYTLDKALVAEVGPIFKSMNLSQDQAQQLVDFYTKQSQAAVDRPHQEYAATRKAWQDEVKADPDIGPKLGEVKATIGRALAGLGDPKLTSDFRQAMDLTGAGDHPAFIKAFYKLAQKATEGRPVNGSGPSPGGQGTQNRPTAAQALFPNLPSAMTS